MGERIYEVTGDVHDDHYNFIAKERMAKAFQAIVANEIDEVLSREIECYDLPSQAVHEGQMMLLALAVQMAADTGDNLQGTQAEVAARVAMTYGRGAKATITKETGAAYPDGDRQHARLLIETQQLSLSKDPEDQKRFRGFQTMVETATSGVVHVPALQSSEKRPSTMPSVVRKMAVAAGIAGAVTAAQALYGVQPASAATPHETNKNTPDKTIVVDNNVPKNGIDLMNMKVTVAPAPVGSQKPDTQPQFQAQEQPGVQPATPSSKELPQQLASSIGTATANENTSLPTATPAEQSSKAVASTDILASTAQSAVPTNNSDPIPTEASANSARSTEIPQYTAEVPDKPQRLPVISQIEHKADTAPSEYVKDTLPLLNSADQPDLLQMNPKNPSDGHNATLAAVVATAPEVVVGTIPDITAISTRHGEEAAVVPAAPTISEPDLTQLHDGNLQDATPYTPPPAVEKAPAPTPAPAPAPIEQAPSSAPAAEAGPYTLGADQQGLIDSLNLTPAKKDFLKQVSAGAIGLRQHGSNINPEVVIAQAILESAWGSSQLTTQAHNYFGMKAGADWKGKTVIMPTQEVENGQWITVNATWKAFDNAEDCFAEYAKFIANSPNFKDALAYPDDPTKYVQALLNRDNGQSAYATDPDYAAKILGTVRANHIDQVVNIARKAQSDKASADKATADKKAADTQAAEVAAKKVETAAFTGWESPVEGNPPITSGFGERGTGANRTFHSGIDYGLSTGHNLLAMGTGVVKTVITGDVRTQQWCINALASVGASTADVKDPIQKEVYVHVTADDGHTYDIIYAHLSKINVTDGQVVHAGESIGESGGSGCSTGDHVHIEVHQDGKAIDPHVLLGNVKVASSAERHISGGEGAASPASEEYGDGFVVPDNVIASIDKSNNEVSDRVAVLRRLSMIKEHINAG